MPELKEEIKAAVDEIRSKAGAETADKIEDNLISIVTKTNSMVTSFKEQESEIKELRAEAYTKRHALKDYEKDSQVKIQDYEDRIKTFEDNSNNDELNSEVERLRGFEKETIESQRIDFKSWVEGVKDNDKFSKVVNRFKLPSNDDGIDYEKFDTIEYPDLKHNLAQMKDLQDLEYFDSAPGKQQPPPPGGKAQRGSDKSFQERMAQAQTPRQIKEVLDSEGL
jgi:hypothetical protein